MKLKVRYQVLIKSKKIIDNYPKRIKLFYRVKWKKFITRNRYKIRRYKFKNFFIRSFSKKRYRFIRMKKYYKQSMIRKIRLQQMYNNSYNFKKLEKYLIKSKSLSYIDLLTNILAFNLFFLEILLWNMHFYKTTYEARYNIDMGFVLVNNKKVQANYFLKLGDIITFTNKTIDFKTNFKKYKLFEKFHSYVEFNLYTLTIVVVKDFTNFNLDDYACAFSRPVRVAYIKNLVK